jgi:glycosyltransferase involved in cell wall biosynthesis
MEARLKSAGPQPYFGASETPATGTRRLLLITLAFPPDQSIGSLRWQKLSAYAAERGWQLDVVTVDPSYLESADPSRLTELPPHIRVYGIRVAAPWIERVGLAVWKAYRRFRPRRTNRTSRDGPTVRKTDIGTPESVRSAEIRWTWQPRQLIRAYHGWLEYVRLGRWARDAATLALRLIEPGIHEAVITSGPPHMAHDAGRLVSRASGLPFIMDLRDPWSLVQRIPESAASPVWLRLAERHERRAIGQAALVVTNTEPCRVVMCKLYPEARDRIITVMNGCDTDPLPPSRHGHRFTIGYAGGIYFGRDPRVLFQAAARLIGEFALGPADFGLEFLGHVEQYGSTLVSDIAREEGVERFVTLEPTRPRREALEFLARATMLVALPQDADLAIPAKIFEYARFDAWILALATHDSATGLLLRDSGADIVAPDDLEGLVRVLRERFLQYRQGIRPQRIARDGRFSRRAQAQRLLDAIAACTNGSRSAANLRSKRPA